MKKQNYNEKDLREKIKALGKSLGFEVDEEWTPAPLRLEDRREVYIPRIDIVWYKKADPRLVEFIKSVERKMHEKIDTREHDKLLGIVPKYRDIENEIVIGFELELSDRPTKYILGDISNLSRMCDYGFIVITETENLVKRAIKASRAFSVLHGASNVFIISPLELEEITEKILSRK